MVNKLFNEPIDAEPARVRIRDTSISGIKLLRPEKHGDSRGFFSEVHSKKALVEAGIEIDFVQDNHSLSVHRGTVRGLHFQTPPFSQDKLVRVVRGSAFDVAVDLRRNSATYGQHTTVVLSAEAWNQVLIPIGFAHGFMTLEPDTEVLYKVSNHYSPEHDRGLLWNDPALGIQWPLPADEALLSDKDMGHPTLAELTSPFGP